MLTGEGTYPDIAEMGPLSRERSRERGRAREGVEHLDTSSQARPMPATAFAAAARFTSKLLCEAPLWLTPQAAMKRVAVILLALVVAVVLTLWIGVPYLANHD